MNMIINNRDIPVTITATMRVMKIPCYMFLCGMN